MELGEMKLAALYTWLEARMSTQYREAIGWDNKYTKEIRAEIEKRLEAGTSFTADTLASCPDYLPVPSACPCPVVPEFHKCSACGTGISPRWKHCPWCGHSPSSPVVGEGERGTIVMPCPKCGEGKLYEVLPDKTARAIVEGPCGRCIANRPDASSGYEHVGEWRVPEIKEWFIGCDGRASIRWPRSIIRQDIDGGKRWILYKKPEEKVVLVCPKCRNVLVAGPVNARRVESHTTCIDCEAARPPAKSGYEYTGEWELPGPDDDWLDYTGKYVGHGSHPTKNIDQGRRWIMKKVEEAKYPRWFVSSPGKALYRFDDEQHSVIIDADGLDAKSYWKDAGECERQEQMTEISPAEAKVYFPKPTLESLTRRVEELEKGK